MLECEKKKLDTIKDPFLKLFPITAHINPVTIDSLGTFPTSFTLEMLSSRKAVSFEEQ